MLCQSWFDGCHCWLVQQCPSIYGENLRSLTNCFGRVWHFPMSDKHCWTSQQGRPREDSSLAFCQRLLNTEALIDNRLERGNMQRSLHPPIGLYVHVPFCASKCAYCDFASYAGREADIPRYVDAVIREITRRGAETGHPKADTIFLGGGTPSLLDEFQATRILDALFEAFPMEEGAEITCECNPGTLTTPFAQALRKAGVNRLSLGAQARQSRLLRLIGRIHNWENVIASVEIAREAGFDNINLDLMLGLPSQTVSDVRETLAGRDCALPHASLLLRFDC